jgi:recombination protein RecT
MASEQEKAQQHLDGQKASRENQVQTLQRWMDSPKIRTQIERSIPGVLARALSPDRIVAMALTMVRGSEALQRCTPISIVAAVVQAAQLGLVPDGVLGHAYLVPRKGQAVFQLGYRGAVAVAYRTDKVRIRGRAVRACDHFLAVEGSDHRVEHRRLYGPGAVESPIVAAYATAEFPDGGRDERVMDMWEIEKAKKVSASVKSGKTSPWDEWPEQMCEKTAIHRLMKQLPLSTETILAVTRDDAVSAGARVTPVELQSGEVDTVIDATSVEEGEGGE